MKYLTDVILLLLKFAADASPDGSFNGITRLEKLIFLLKQEFGLEDWIRTDNPQFIPYKLGPYSRDVYKGIEFLCSYELISDSHITGDSHLDSMEEVMTSEPSTIAYTERRFQLTSDGERAANELLRTTSPDTLIAIRRCYEQYGNKSLSHLLRYVYQHYPEFTGESIIKNQVLGNY